MTSIAKRPASFLLACALGAAAKPASACDCARPVPSPEAAFEAAAFVVEGRVGEVRAQSFELAVESRFKGPARARVEVRNEGGSCGYRLTKGARVLVYAGEAEGRLYVRQCAGTRLVLGEAARSEGKRWATLR
jgi:hypothetical protein